MKWWALVVVALYFLILVAQSVPLIVLVFAPEANWKDTASGTVSWAWLEWPGVMALVQAALLVVPVQMAGGLPVARRSLLWPVVTAGLMITGLAAGAFLYLFEFARQDRVPRNGSGGPHWLRRLGSGLSGRWCSTAPASMRSAGGSCIPDPRAIEEIISIPPPIAAWLGWRKVLINSPSPHTIISGNRLNHRP